MKRLKKMMALIIAVAMVLGMTSMAAFADDPPTTGTITITNSADGTVTASERTFKAYRILDATEVFGNGNDQPATGYAYTIPSAAARTALANKFLTDDAATTDVNEKEQGANETVEQYDARIINAINAAATADVEQTAKDLLAIAKATSGIASVELTGGTPSGQLPFGYYVIEDTTSPAKNNVSAVMLDTNNPNVQIKVKATQPSLEKKIDEGSTAGAIDATDVVYDNHRVGDTVPYILKSTIPDMTGYTKYFYVVEDTLSKGLTFNGDDVVIKVTKAAVEDDPATQDVNEAAAAVTRTLTKDTDYTFTKTTNDDGTTSIKIVFKDFYNKEKAHAGEEMIITYSATINADAVIGVEGNPNTAKLTFSNNPNTTPSSETDEPGPGDVTGETPEQKTFTYVTGLKLKKTDSSNNPLAGATFELSGNLNKVEVIKAEKFVQDENGTYYALTDGTYTTVDPTTIDTSLTNYNEIIAKYVDNTGATKFKKTTVTEQTAAGTPKKVSETTDASGILIFDGMGDGVFTITETAAPTGYNKLQTPIEFEVEWVAPTSGSTDCTWKVKNNTIKPADYNISFNSASGEFEITIVNQTGQELPSTGGIGTTIFYIVGTILVIGAGVILITKRRMDA